MIERRLVYHTVHREIPRDCVKGLAFLLAVLNSCIYNFFGL